MHGEFSVPPCAAPTRNYRSIGGSLGFAQSFRFVRRVGGVLLAIRSERVTRVYTRDTARRRLITITLGTQRTWGNSRATEFREFELTFSFMGYDAHR